MTAMLPRILLAVAILAPSTVRAESHINQTDVHELADALSPQTRIHKAVKFEYGRRRIYSKTREELADIAAACRTHPNMKITVEGHAFAYEEEASIALGESRASLVRTLLIRYGVAPDNVTAIDASRVGEPGRYVDLVIEDR
jgi:outer membrane protein OmpA-like peptidoglycan-associated protein